MSSTQYACCYTEGVTCDASVGRNCARCGFNPAVQKKRVAKIRNEIKNGKPAKKRGEKK